MITHGAPIPRMESWGRRPGPLPPALLWGLWTPALLSIPFIATFGPWKLHLAYHRHPSVISPAPAHF